MVDAQLSAALGDAIEYEWSHDKIIEVVLNTPNDFLRIKETLTRIGIANTRTKTLTQSCHILHRAGQYYIVHFKELFRLEGCPSVIKLSDIARRNAIIHMLETWGLLKVLDPSKIMNRVPVSQVFVVPFNEKPVWNLKAKHRLGGKKNATTNQ